MSSIRRLILRTPRQRPFLSLCALALTLTALNAAKPLHMDDAGFYVFARQIAEHPTSPYGFTIVWDGVPRPAIEILAPPVLPYWWATGMLLFGDSEVMWKLWLLPVHLVLVFSLAALLRRFVRRFTGPILWMTVLSPVVLPGINLMTDIPALTLSLLALVLFMRGCDRRSLGFVTLAGLAAGIAMQTKYTAFVTPLVLVLYGFLHQRTRWGLAAGMLAAGLFVSWEALMALVHGQSHFLAVSQMFQHPGNGLAVHALQLLSKLPWLVGGLLPALWLLGLAALGWRRGLVGVGALIVGTNVILGILPERATWLFCSPETGRPRVELSHVITGVFGIACCVTVVLVARRLLRGTAILRVDPAGLPLSQRILRVLQDPSGRIERFLLLWLGLELAGYAVLSPFAAARRVVALMVVATLLVGRLAARGHRQPRKRLAVTAVAAGSVLLGLTVFGVDYLEARAMQEAAEFAARSAGGRSEGKTDWFVGCWGFSYYGERAGLQPLVLDCSHFRPGDHLVVDDGYYLYHPNFVEAMTGHIQMVDRITVADAVPLRTVVDYYAGRRPLSRLEGPRASATVYRVVADFVPRRTRSSP
jgi:hypothetical protein